MKQNEKTTRILSVILLILSAALMLGVKLVFHACGAKEDGSWMTCHWAENAVCASGAVMTVISVIALCLKGRARAGAAFSLVPAAVVTALLPQVLIRMCMMNDMRCHAMMRPAVILLCAVIGVLAAVTGVMANREEG